MISSIVLSDLSLMPIHIIGCPLVPAGTVEDSKGQILLCSQLLMTILDQDGVK